MKIVAIVLILFPLLGYAGSRDHYSHQDDYEREHRHSLFWEDVRHQRNKQEVRIDRGVDRGQLTRREIKFLRKNQRSLEKTIRKYEHRYFLSASKKRHIMSCLYELSEKISELKHNDRYHLVERSRYKKHSYYKSVRRGESYDRRHNASISWTDKNTFLTGAFRF